jgi:hypothetical protein
MDQETHDDLYYPFFVCFRSENDLKSCRVIKRYPDEPGTEDALQAGQAWASGLGEERGAIEIWRVDEMTARRTWAYPQMRRYVDYG